MIAGISRSVDSERKAKLKQETWRGRTMKVIARVWETLDLGTWTWKTMMRERIVWRYVMNTLRVTRRAKTIVLKVSIACNFRRRGILKIDLKSKCQSLLEIKIEFWRTRSILNILGKSNREETIWIWTRYVGFTNIFKHHSWENCKTETTSEQKSKTYFKRTCRRNRRWHASNIWRSWIWQTIAKIKQTFVLSWHQSW